VHPPATPAAAAPAALARLAVAVRRRRLGLVSGSGSSASAGRTGGGTSAPWVSPATSRRRIPFSDRNDEMLDGVELSVWAIHTSV